MDESVHQVHIIVYLPKLCITDNGILKPRNVATRSYLYLADFVLRCNGLLRATLSHLSLHPSLFRQGNLG